MISGQKKKKQFFSRSFTGNRLVLDRWFDELRDTSYRSALALTIAVMPRSRARPRGIFVGRMSSVRVRNCARLGVTCARVVGVPGRMNHSRGGYRAVASSRDRQLGPSNSSIRVWRICGTSQRKALGNGQRILFNRLQCSCDEKFFDCLHRSEDSAGSSVGYFYFNVLDTKCFREDYPIVGCKRATT